MMWKDTVTSAVCGRCCMFVLTIAFIFVLPLLEFHASVPCYTQCTRLVHYGCVVVRGHCPMIFLGVRAFRALDPLASCLLEPGCCSHKLFSASVKLPPSPLPVPPRPHSNIRSYAHCVSLKLFAPMELHYFFNPGPGSLITSHSPESASPS